MINWRKYRSARAATAPGSLKSLFLTAFAVSLGVNVTPASAIPDRVTVNAMEYPWSAIGKIETSIGHCSGFLISQKHVLTAAHCLYDVQARRWVKASEVRFTAGYQNGQHKLTSQVRRYKQSKNTKNPRTHRLRTR